mgnify:CR=1 FL=1
MLKRTYSIIAAFLAAGLSAFAQSGEYGSYSPYSIFGIGNLSDAPSAYTSGMAGVGIASRNNRYINTMNPAAVSVRDSLALMIDFSVYNTNTILTLGFLFQKEETAQALVALYDECFALAEQNASDGSLSGVAASMNGYFSSADSDYTAVLLKAGLSFGLEGFDFGDKTSIKAADNLDVYNTEKYDFDYIVHIRTAADYGGTLSQSTVQGYADSFELWQYSFG